MTPRDQAAVTLHPAADTVVGFGPFRFDRGSGLLWRGSEELPLPPRALAVLSALVERAGRVVGKHELLQVAWNGAYVTETSLSEAVSLLRQTLGDDSQQPVYIQTVHRRGYRFIARLRLEESGERAALEPVRDDGPWPAPVVLPGERNGAAGRGAELALAVAASSRAALPAGGALPAGSITAPAPSPPLPFRRRALAMTIAVVALVLAAAAGGFIAGRERRRPAPPPVPTRFAVAPPAPWKLVEFRPSLAVSPDGRRIVFVAFDGDGPDDKDTKTLFVRDLDSLVTRRLPGTTGAHTPFFSPDGRSVAYFADRQLWRVALAGGPPVALAPALGEGASWGDDGTIVFASGRPTSLYRLPASGGKPQRLTTLDPNRGEVSHSWPQVLPGGAGVVFTAWSTTLHDAKVEWLSFANGERRTLVVGGAAARYADGRLLWARPNGTVVVAPFDARTARLLGEPAPLLADVVPHPFYAFAQLAVGGDTLVHLPRTATAIGQRRLARLDGDAEQPLPVPSRFYRNLVTSRGGRLAATLLERDRSDVWVIEPRDGTMQRLTFDGFNIEPVWSPDGRWVAYASNRLGPFNVFRRKTDGSAPAERVMTSAHHQHPVSWSPDGRELMFGDVGPDTGFDLWVLDLASGRRRPLVRTAANEIYAAWSPDGRWVAYCTDESGKWESVVSSYPDLAGRWQLSTDGGFDPFWSADGRTVYFQSDGDVWAVPVAPVGRELHPGAVRRVTKRDDLEIVSAAPGGGLYAILEQRPFDRKATPPEVRVVMGWQAMLPPAR
jgi:Tol biopolymer transport system component/DNA-binding winged helix-turn-helix (wHTH) protein